MDVRGNLTCCFPCFAAWVFTTAHRTNSQRNNASVKHLLAESKHALQPGLGPVHTTPAFADIEMSDFGEESNSNLRQSDSQRASDDSKMRPSVAERSPYRVSFNTNAGDSRPKSSIVGGSASQQTASAMPSGCGSSSNKQSDQASSSSSDSSDEDSGEERSHSTAGGAKKVAVVVDKQPAAKAPVEKEPVKHAIRQMIGNNRVYDN